MKNLRATIIGILFLVASAWASGQYQRENQGPCEGGYWPDANDCCPKLVRGGTYYRDSFGCYPVELECGVLYADDQRFCSLSSLPANSLI